MKKKRAIVISGSILCFFTAPMTGQSLWNLVAPFPPPLAAYSAVTVGNKAYFWCANNVVWSTSDGGSQITVYPPYGPISDVALGCCHSQGMAFADTLIGFITDVAHGDFRTTDGGLTWSQVAGVGMNDQIVLFGNAKTGWKFGGGAVYRTTDAGQTWDSQMAPFGGLLSRGFALDSSHVWLATSFQSGTPPAGSIWYSFDSGIHWNRLAAALTSDSLTQVSYSDLRFSESGLGLAIGTVADHSGTTEGFASRSTDFGISWSTTYFPNESPTTILSVSEDCWIMLGGGSATYERRSTDSGMTWSSASNVFDVQGYNYNGSATFVPATKMLVASILGEVFSSVDSGVTFTRMNNSLSFPISDLALDSKSTDPSTQMIFAPSNDGRFLLSTDAGRTWRSDSIPFAGSYIFSQSVVADNVIYFVPGRGRLFRSSDLGRSWEAVHVPTSGSLNALTVFDKDHISVQGYEGLYYSTDAGDTWTNAAFPGTYWLNQCAMPLPAMIAGGGGFYDSTGTHGFLFRTTDGGFNWNIVDVPKEIKIVKMVTPSEGFACSDYEFYRTRDGGKSWNLILSSNDYFTHYEDFFFDDSLHGLLRVSFDFQETTDGGDTWHAKPMGLPIYTVDRFARTFDGTMLAVGAGMLWSQTSTSSPRIAIESASKSDQTEVTLNIFPNPFNPSTTIQFSVAVRSRVQLKVYNILGQQIAELANEVMDAGTYRQVWNANVASGLYFCRIEAVSVDDPGKRFGDVKKMILLK